MMVFRMLILVATVLIGSSLIRSWHNVQLAQSPTPSSSPAIAMYEFVATHGVGMTHLAARALDAYLPEHSIRLDAAQHLYATDTLAHHVGWRPLTAGEKIVFDTSIITQAIISAKAMTAAQRASWSRLVH
jgi:hypothetical protein